MAAHNAYPTSADLRVFLVSMEIPEAKVDAQNLDAAIDGAIEQWQDDTGYHPFLSDGNTRTIRFRAPRSATLEFGSGFVSVSDVRSDGEPFVEGEDYELRPYNAPSQNKPFTELKLMRRCARTVLVTGVLGFSATLSQRAFDAIVQSGALKLAAPLGAALAATAGSAGGEIKSRQTGDTKIEYSTASEGKTTKFSSELPLMRASYQEAVESCKLEVFGL